jgi:hypothetical protein
MTPDLQPLLSRLEKAKEGNWRLDKAVSEKVVGRTYFGGRDQQYTRSVDAALSLVPEGWSWEVRKSEFGDCCQANCWNPAGPYPRHLVQGRASLSPALALCLAALRARGA